MLLRESRPHIVPGHAQRLSEHWPTINAPPRDEADAQSHVDSGADDDHRCLFATIDEAPGEKELFKFSMFLDFGCNTDKLPIQKPNTYEFDLGDDSDEFDLGDDSKQQSLHSQRLNNSVADGASPLAVSLNNNKRRAITRKAAYGEDTRRFQQDVVMSRNKLAADQRISEAGPSSLLAGEERVCVIYPQDESCAEIVHRDSVASIGSNFGVPHTFVYESELQNMGLQHLVQKQSEEDDMPEATTQSASNYMNATTMQSNPSRNEVAQPTELDELWASKAIMMISKYLHKHGQFPDPSLLSQYRRISPYVEQQIRASGMQLPDDDTIDATQVYKEQLPSALNIDTVHYYLKLEEIILGLRLELKKLSKEEIDYPGTQRLKIEALVGLVEETKEEQNKTRKEILTHLNNTIAYNGKSHSKIVENHKIYKDIRGDPDASDDADGLTVSTAKELASKDMAVVNTGGDKSANMKRIEFPSTPLEWAINDVYDTTIEEGDAHALVEKRVKYFRLMRDLELERDRTKRNRLEYGEQLTKLNTVIIPRAMKDVNDRETERDNIDKEIETAKASVLKLEEEVKLKSAAAHDATGRLRTETNPDTIEMLKKQHECYTDMLSELQQARKQLAFLNHNKTENSRQAQAIELDLMRARRKRGQVINEREHLTYKSTAVLPDQESQNILKRRERDKNRAQRTLENQNLTPEQAEEQSIKTQCTVLMKQLNDTIDNYVETVNKLDSVRHDAEQMRAQKKRELLTSIANPKDDATKIADQSKLHMLLNSNGKLSAKLSINAIRELGFVNTKVEEFCTLQKRKDTIKSKLRTNAKNDGMLKRLYALGCSNDDELTTVRNRLKNNEVLTVQEIAKESSTGTAKYNAVRSDAGRALLAQANKEKNTRRSSEAHISNPTDLSKKEAETRIQLAVDEIVDYAISGSTRAMKYYNLVVQWMKELWQQQSVRVKGDADTGLNGVSSMHMNQPRSARKPDQSKETDDVYPDWEKIMSHYSDHLEDLRTILNKWNKLPLYARGCSLPSDEDVKSVLHNLRLVLPCADGHPPKIDDQTSEIVVVTENDMEVFKKDPGRFGGIHPTTPLIFVTFRSENGKKTHVPLDQSLRAIRAIGVDDGESKWDFHSTYEEQKMRMRRTDHFQKRVAVVSEASDSRYKAEFEAEVYTACDLAQKWVPFNGSAEYNDPSFSDFDEAMKLSIMEFEKRVGFQKREIEKYEKTLRKLEQYIQSLLHMDPETSIMTEVVPINSVIELNNEASRVINDTTMRITPSSVSETAAANKALNDQTILTKKIEASKEVLYSLGAPEGKIPYNIKRADSSKVTIGEVDVVLLEQESYDALEKLEWLNNDEMVRRAIETVNKFVIMHYYWWGNIAKSREDLINTYIPWIKRLRDEGYPSPRLKAPTFDWMLTGIRSHYAESPTLMGTSPDGSVPRVPRKGYAYQTGYRFGGMRLSWQLQSSGMPPKPSKVRALTIPKATHKEPLQALNEVMQKRSLLTDRGRQADGLTYNQVYSQASSSVQPYAPSIESNYASATQTLQAAVEAKVQEHDSLFDSAAHFDARTSRISVYWDVDNIDDPRDCGFYIGRIGDIPDDGFTMEKVVSAILKDSTDEGQTLRNIRFGILVVTDNGKKMRTLIVHDENATYPIHNEIANEEERLLKQAMTQAHVDDYTPSPEGIQFVKGDDPMATDAGLVSSLGSLCAAILIYDTGPVKKPLLADGTPIRPRPLRALKSDSIYYL